MVVFFVFVCISCIIGTSSKSFTIDYAHDTFLKDGEPFNYVSGSIHYARVPHYYWEDRLRKMYAAGLDAIQTYVHWNVHEPKSGQYDFEGQQDLVTFLTIANKIGLLAIVRAGPYICGEWEFGGFPAWILAQNASIVLRSMDPGYIKPVDRWLGVLLPKLKPLLYSNGGPIILTQLENEYGSFFTCDHNYMAHLRDTFRTHLGDSAVLITTDGAGLQFLKCGTVDGVYATVDFGPGNATRGFAPMRLWNPHGPLVNSEFYTGWLDHWGSPHAHGNTENIISTLQEILGMNASVNFYMFEGGTNFGYMNGVNAPFNPVPTSYDYDAPLTEAGDITSKYMAIRTAISKYKKLPDVPIPPSTPKHAYGKVDMNLLASLFSAVRLVQDPKPVKSLYPLSMEQIGQSYGFVTYSHKLTRTYSGEQLQVFGLRDRAYVGLQNSAAVITMLDRNGATSFNFVASKGDTIVILVENMGRVNFGKEMIGQNKGIVGNVTVGGKNLTNWYTQELPLAALFDLKEQLANIPQSLADTRYPRLYEGSFMVPRNTSNATYPMDTYISMPGWFKGILFINKHNLGRYWPARGPQMTLYVPKGVLLPYPYKNNIQLVELDSSPCDQNNDNPTNQIPVLNDVLSNQKTEVNVKFPSNDLDGVDGRCKVVFVDTPVLNGTTYLSDSDNIQDVDKPKYGHGV